MPLAGGRDDECSYSVDHVRVIGDLARSTPPRLSTWAAGAVLSRDNRIGKLTDQVTLFHGEGHRKVH